MKSCEDFWHRYAIGECSPELEVGISFLGFRGLGGSAHLNRVSLARGSLDREGNVGESLPLDLFRVCVVLARLLHHWDHIHPSGRCGVWEHWVSSSPRESWFPTTLRSTGSRGPCSRGGRLGGPLPHCPARLLHRMVQFLSLALVNVRSY